MNVENKTLYKQASLQFPIFIIDKEQTVYDFQIEDDNNKLLQLKHTYSKTFEPETEVTSNYFSTRMNNGFLTGFKSSDQLFRFFLSTKDLNNFCLPILENQTTDLKLQGIFNCYAPSTPMLFADLRFSSLKKLNNVLDKTILYEYGTYLYNDSSLEKIFSRKLIDILLRENADTQQEPLNGIVYNAKTLEGKVVEVVVVTSHVSLLNYTSRVAYQYKREKVNTAFTYEAKSNKNILSLIGRGYRQS